MLLVGFLSWWYGDGWMQRFFMIRKRFDSILDFFSPKLLLQTWFAPFRQISAGKVNGSFAVQWQAFVDRFVSRLIGGVVRTVLLIAAGCMLVAQSCIAVVELAIWSILPFIPLAGLVLALSGWVPSWT